MIGLNNLKRNKMNKEFIPYEESLALKELGFNDYCLGLYSYSSKNTIDMQHVIHTCKASSKLVWMRVPTPTFSQAFRWFRENYKLTSFISQWVDTNEFYFEIPFLEEKAWDDKYNSYEEAELACLRKLIEIV